jgi:hypothetical protein
MPKEYLSKLQKWILTTLLAQGQLKHREIYAGFYRIADDPDQDSRRAQKVKKASGIVSKSLRRLIEKGFIRCYLDYPAEELTHSLPYHTKIELTETGLVKAVEMKLLQLRASERMQT